MVRYKPLVGSDFRLLRLNPLQSSADLVRCDLVQTPLDATGLTYTALSYVWGTEPAATPILLDGEETLVRANLEACLRQLCQPEEEHWGRDGKPDGDAVVFYLWADAVCINQDDIAERNAQVLRMKNIYADAERVIVWLGPEADHTRAGVTRMAALGENFYEIFEKEATSTITGEARTGAADLGFLDRLTESTGRQWQALVSEDVEGPEMEGVLDFFARSWFRRVWVVQEFGLAREAVFRCGSVGIGAERLTSSAMGLSWAIAKTPDFLMPSPSAIQPERRAFCLAHVQFLIIMMGEYCVEAPEDRKNSSISRTMPLEKLLQILVNHHATNPLDYIYGILGISSDFAEGDIAPDYNASVAEVFMGAVEALMKQSDSPSILRQCSGATSRTVDLPSWVPAWGRLGLGQRNVVARPFPSQDQLVLERDGALKPPFWASKGLKLSSHPWRVDLASRRLHLGGILLDQVLRVVPLKDPKEITPRSLIQVLNELVVDLAPDTTVKYPIYEQSADLAAASTISIGMYFHKHTLETSFRRHGNHAHTARGIHPRVLRDGRRQWSEDTMDVAALQYMLDQGLGRRLAVTSKGFFALLPGEVEVGDQVALLVGSPVLFLLREQHGVEGRGGREWMMLGEAFVHGWMHGRAFEYGEVEEIVLV